MDLTLELATPAPDVQVGSTPILKERLRLSLRTGEILPLAPLDGEVTLVDGSFDLIPRQDGRFIEKGHGRLRFTRPGEPPVDLDFDEGAPFEVWGYDMAVFGGAGVFELSVFPEGEPVTP